MTRLLTGLLSAAIIAGCTEPVEPQEPNGPYFEEPQPETVVYTRSQLAYRGDDTYSGISDEWTLTLYTDNYPVGPAHILQLDFNATYSNDQTPALANITGIYSEQQSTGDFSVGSFNWGVMDRVEVPGGVLEVPALSYYGEIADGETEFDADLLIEGAFQISDNGDGTFTVEGIVVGRKYTKRYFSYRGELTPVAYVEPKAPNSTLTGDITLTGFTQGRIYDRFNRFALPDPKEGDDPNMPNGKSYRYFEVCLAQPGIDLGKLVPDGNGQLLQLDILVPYESAAADGIPAGEYTVTRRIGSGIDRADIVPFRFLEGQADMFSRPAGTWLRTMNGTQWVDPYARVTDGKITVERPNGGHRITVELLDCSEPAHRITGTFEFAEPLAVFE